MAEWHGVEELAPQYAEERGGSHLTRWASCDLLAAKLLFCKVQPTTKSLSEHLGNESWLQRLLILLETCVFDFSFEWQTYVYNIYIVFICRHIFIILTHAYAYIFDIYN